MIITDKSGKKWECFIDESYYQMLCIRPINDKDFSSKDVHHFMSKQQMEQFIKILKGE